MLKKIKDLANKIADYVKDHVHNAASTLTNLSYILIGYVNWPIQPFISFLLIILGIASTGFHWTRSRMWHTFDIVAIFYVFSTIAGWLWIGATGVWIGLALGTIGHYLWHYKYAKSKTIIGVYGLFCLIPYFIINGVWATLNVLFWFGLALGVSQIATYFEPEEDGKIYDAFHAIWHIFSAIGIFYLMQLTGPAGVLLR